MRLGLCALSAVLLSGCSWLGSGGHNSHYAYETSAGANCAPMAYGQNAYGYGFQQSTAAQAYGSQGYGFNAGACGAGGAYGVGQGAYGQAGFGQGGFAQGGAAQGFYGQGAGAQGMMAQSGFSQMGYGQMGYAQGGIPQGGFGQAGFGQGGFSQGSFGQSAYGAGGFTGATTLGTGAPYGSALGGVYGQNVVGTQLSNGQYVNGAYVQNVQGSALYVPQPYPVYYGTQQFRGAYGGFGGVGGVALPFGVETGIGTNFDIGGDVFTEKAAGPASGNPAVNTGGTEGISYGDAFSNGTTIGGALTYDVSRNTTLLGVVDYTTANGEKVDAYQTVDARGAFESIDAEFSDLDLWTIEGGVRQYIGQSPALRPYVGATAGFTHNNEVTLNRTYTADGAAFDATPLEYIDSGWNPTASAVVGAEMAVGSRAAIGVESGIRWRDNMDTLFESEDRWSVPVKLRGRVSF